MNDHDASSLLVGRSKANQTAIETGRGADYDIEADIDMIKAIDQKEYCQTGNR